MSLRKKLVILVECLAIGGVVLASAVIYRNASRELEQTARRNLDHTAYLVATQAKRSLGQLTQLVEFWAGTPLVRDAALDYRDPRQADEFNRFFAGVRGVTQLFQSINLVNLDADCVASSNFEGIRLYHPEHRRVVAQRSDFLAAKNGRTGVSDTILSRGTGRPGLGISVPVRHEGTVVAVLRAVLDLGFFHTRYLAPLRIGAGGRVVVFDPALELTLGDDWQPPDPLDAAPYEPPDIPVPSSEFTARRGILRYTAPDGPYLAAYHRTLHPSWVFVVFQPLGDVLRPVRQVRQVAMAVAVVLSGLIGSSIYLLSRRVLSDLGACQTFARRIQAGSLAERLTVRSGDEIGQLGQSLNSMAASLQQSQEALRAAEYRYRNIFENAFEAIFVTTEHGRFVTVNPAGARLLGYSSPDEVIGTDATMTYGNPARRKEVLERLGRDGKVSGFEFEFVRRDGQQRIASLHASATWDEAGSVRLIQGFVMDVTERRRAEQDRERAGETERLLAEARLQALRYQINPHFLFNVLNTIEALSRQVPQEVPALIGKLSRYLRTSLDTSEEKTVSLQDEIELVGSYLGIEKCRFEDDLRFEFDIAPETATLLVPCLILQPLVENAVKHGMRAGPAPLHLSIRSDMHAERLCIEVANTGHWFDNSDGRDGKSGRGIGLRNLRQRLNLLFRDTYRLEHKVRNGQVVVTLELPVKQRGSAEG